MHPERGERNTNDRVDESRRTPDGGKKILTGPAAVDSHRAAHAIRRLDSRVKRRPQRIHLDLEVRCRRCRREKHLDDVFLIERVIVISVPGDHFVVRRVKKNVQVLPIGVGRHCGSQAGNAAVGGPPELGGGDPSSPGVVEDRPARAGVPPRHP